MTHDPLCTTVLNTEVNEAFCNCDLIARVREDERTYAKQTSTAVMAYEEGRLDGFDHGVAEARTAVAALPHEDGCCSNGCACQRWDKQEPCDLSCNCSFWWMPHALAAIDALEKP